MDLLSTEATRLALNSAIMSSSSRRSGSGDSGGGHGRSDGPSGGGSGSGAVNTGVNTNDSSASGTIVNRLPKPPVTATGAAQAIPPPERKEPVVEEARRLLKRMRPEELREISRAATELEKAKLEDKAKVEEFVAKNENFVAIVGECYICMEPLLNNIGTSKFGVLSWRCRCTVPQAAHSACLFSKLCHGKAGCDMCHAPMLFEKSRRRGRVAKIHFHRTEQRTDDADPSSDDEDEESLLSLTSSDEESSGDGSEESDVDEESEAESLPPPVVAA